MMTQGDPRLAPDLPPLLRIYFPAVAARTGRLRGHVRTRGSTYFGAINICRRIHRVEIPVSGRNAMIFRSFGGPARL